MAHSATGPAASHLERGGDLSVGVDLSWRMGALIESGRLPSDTRLPGVRDLADAAGVNTNTARGLYRRLEEEGVVVSRHGSGTFVAPNVRVSPSLEELAARVSAEALSQGIDPRQLGRALYCGSPGEDPFPTLPPDRDALRAQIARLEATLAAFPDSKPVGHASRSAIPGPHIPSVEELESIRDQLLDSIDDARARAAKAAERERDMRRPRGAIVPEDEQRPWGDRPAAGPIGALMDWWRATLSGSSRSTASSPKRSWQPTPNYR